MLYEIYGDSGVSRTTVFEWYKQFVGVRKDDPKTEKPSTSKTKANIEKVCQLIYSDLQLTIFVMADEPEIAKETVRISSMEKLGMQNPNFIPWQCTRSHIRKT